MSVNYMYSVLILLYGNYATPSIHTCIMTCLFYIYVDWHARMVNITSRIACRVRNLPNWEFHCTGVSYGRNLLRSEKVLNSCTITYWVARCVMTVATVTKLATCTHTNICVYRYTMTDI